MGDMGTMTTPTTTAEPARLRAALVLALASGAALAASPAAAQDLSPISNMLETILDALTGPIGAGLAAIGVVVLGYLLIFTGRVSPGFVAALVIGIVLVFSAVTVIDGFDTASGG